MKKLLVLLLTLSACSTTRVTYEIKDSAPEEAEQDLAIDDADVNRAPDIKSSPATVTFDYPERSYPALYEVTSAVNVRDFPSTEGTVIGTLKVGDKVIGNEIEGSWIRIYDNSYTALRYLKRIR